MMDKPKLSPRLRLLAELVPKGAMLADVGTDHGYLPVTLLCEGKIRSAVATDIRQDPLSKAVRCAKENGVLMRCVLCDGLSEVSPEEADTVVIAGMGGENIIDILRRAPWTKNNTLLLLQPMSRAEVLRASLSELGLYVEGERLVEDSGRIYSVLICRGGKGEAYSEAELYTGLFEHIRREPLFTSFLAETKRKFTRAAEGLSRSTREEDLPRLTETKEILAQLAAMEGKYHAESL